MGSETFFLFPCNWCMKKILSKYSNILSIAGRFFLFSLAQSLAKLKKCSSLKKFHQVKFYMIWNLTIDFTRKLPEMRWLDVFVNPREIINSFFVQHNVPHFSLGFWIFRWGAFGWNINQNCNVYKTIDVYVIIKIPGITCNNFKETNAKTEHIDFGT